MTDPAIEEGTLSRRSTRPTNSDGTTKRRGKAVAWAVALAVLSAGLAGTAWLGLTASGIKSELNSATRLLPTLKAGVTANNPTSVSQSADQLRIHTSAAEELAENPIWTLASSLPAVGQNFAAVSEVTRSADDVAELGVIPLVQVFSTLNWNSLLPSGSGTNLEPLRTASPTVSTAAQAVRLSTERLGSIESSKLWPEVAEPLTQAQEQLREVADMLDAAADAAYLAPRMMGEENPRHYLLMIQNNAESRATGGIPGALAILTLDKGKLTLGAQSSAGEVGVMTPTVPVDAQQQQIYSVRLGKFMQDVNLTPDFPSAAKTAQEMWERKTGQRVDGVLSIDPVALSYILEATGPVSFDSGTLITDVGLPAELTGANVVQTLLSDVYSKIEEPKLQDAYFASVAQEIFAALSDGRGDASALISGISRAAHEGRVLVWAGSPVEQETLSRYPVSGSITGPSVLPAQFGVYFNDGTGAKMDYYVQRTVQLIKRCPRDGYEETTVRITSTNTAPADAGSLLPSYVTGAGIFGVPAGSVQTNLVVYGPAQANVETAKSDGVRTEFAPYSHENRPVGVVAVRLAPGETRTTEFTFGKIVQHTEPNVVVTPTVQVVKDVILPTEAAVCG